MAVEWYLLKGKNSLLTGCCCDGNGYIEENFSEALDSVISSDLELYNYDLSVCTSVKGIVQNTVQDTKLKTQSRQILFPVGTCKAGMYVKYKDRFWLIVGMVDDNKMYEKAIVTWCNYYLTWINDKGDIVQRWANVSSASQYNNGETMTDNYQVRTDQLMVLTPDDDECLLLDSGKRFIIDQRCKIYERNIDMNTRYPVAVYRVTRSDSVLFDYQDSGYFEFMAYQDEQRDQDRYYIVDGKGYWLCQEPVSDDKTPILTCSIESDSNEIFNGIDPGKFVAVFTDTDGNVINVHPDWEIRCDFKDQLDVNFVDNSILIAVDNINLVNKSFELILHGSGYQPASITVTIKSFI